MERLPKTAPKGAASAAFSLVQRLMRFAFSNSCVASLTKHLRYEAIAQAYITNIINASRLLKPCQIFGYVNHSREVQACLRGPQPARRPPHSFTNARRVLLKSYYRTVHVALTALSPRLSNVPQSSYNSIVTDSIDLQRSTYAYTTFLKYFTIQRHGRYTEPSS